MYDFQFFLETPLFDMAGFEFIPKVSLGIIFHFIISILLSAELSGAKHLKGIYLSNKKSNFVLVRNSFVDVEAFNYLEDM